MRQDKSDSLRERLRRGAQRFDFDALIQGVSTIEQDKDQDADTSQEDLSADTSGQQSQHSTLQEVSPQERERLRTALDKLGSRLLEETGKLRAALALYDSRESGYYLARVNEILELLQSVDPGGETARRFGMEVAPPAGRSWPPACWTLFELAESPLSGLLPHDADERFAQEVVAAAIATPGRPARQP